MDNFPAGLPPALSHKSIGKLANGHLLEDSLWSPVDQRVRTFASAGGATAVDEVIHLLCHNYISVAALKLCALE